MHQVPVEMLRTHYYEHMHAYSALEAYQTILEKPPYLLLKYLEIKDSATNRDILSLTRGMPSLDFTTQRLTVRHIFCNKYLINMRLLPQNYHI